MLGFLLNDMDKLWGLIGVILIMLIVFILYCIVGVRADARAKKARRKAQMGHAEEMNFNTVEEYDAYLAAEQRQAEEEARIARQQQEDEKRRKNQQRKNAEKAAKKAQAAKKKQQAEAAAMAVEHADENPVQDVINMRAMAQEINMEDIQRVIAEQEEKNAEQAAVSEGLRFADEETLIAEATEKVKEAEQRESLENEQEKEEVSRNASLSEDGSQEIAAAAAPAKKTAGSSLKKKFKNRFSGSLQKEDSLRMDTSASSSDNSTLSLEELQKLVEDGSAYQEIEHAMKEKGKHAFPEATPYVQSIPKILNTKEAIAVSPEAPKVTTFYPDGKVVRDNQLMKKRSYHQGKTEGTVIPEEEAADTTTETTPAEPVNEEQTESMRVPDKKRGGAFSRMKQKISGAMGGLAAEKAPETTAAATATVLSATTTSVGEKANSAADPQKKEAVAENPDLAEENTKTSSDRGEVLMPETPKAFGYQMAWLAIPNSNTAEVLKGLGLKEIAPANWTKGLEQAYQSRDTLFVTPSLHGWNLAIGHALWRKVDINQPIEKNGWLQKLADSFREVFYFSTSSDLNSHGWFYIKNGLLVRAYGYSGELDEVMWNFGPQSQEEHQLIQGFSMGKTKVIPTEKDVLLLAAAWSLDTTFSRESFRPDIGFMGNL